MAKGSKKEANGGKAKSDLEAEERKRLKRLAVSKGMISDTPAKPSASLSLSKLVVKHHGKDIIKKSQRKNKYLFSFPGLLAPVAGGKIGELKDLGTKNPILYLDFPQGRMKLFGTIMYPKNRYLTLQFSRGGKNVMCEDSFDTMIVFSDAWWIGKKEENPGEARLDFPKELTGEQPVECDFRGGAGSTTLFKSGVNQHVPKFVKEQTPMKDLEDDSFKSENDVTEILERTPTRHSARTSNKSYKFAEASSNDASSASDDDISLIAEKKNEAKNSNMHESHADTKEPLTQSKKVSRSSSEVADGVPLNKRGSLIQSTISTLFKKAEEKGEPRSSRKSTPLPVVEQKSQRTKSSRKINVDDDETGGKRKKRKLMKGTNLKTVETQLEVCSLYIHEYIYHPNHTQ
uniref:DNA-binding protein RHL1 n=1 Tax=Kalanchoe fedtschenkoi TaxID=63787 RepID=A0A7N0TF57_KALFE